MKAVIPVAGAGTLLRPHTHTQPKPLIPVAGKPILGHIVESLRGAGLEQFVFVIGHLGEKIREYVTQEFTGKIQFEFVHQEPRLGLGHAVHLCQPVLKKPGGGYDPLVIALGDTILDLDLPAFLQHEGSVVAVQEVDNPKAFGIVVTDERGMVTSMVEKPNIPKSNLALVGLYKIVETEMLMDALQRQIGSAPRSQGEQYHLTDALQSLVAAGVRLHADRVRSWYDCGEKQTLLATNRLMLNRLSPADPATRFPGSIIRPPVYVAEGATIENSIVGPYVALGEHAVVEDSILENSIIGSYARLNYVVLRGSIVGNDASLIGRWQSINIGDNTELDFNS